MKCQYRSPRLAPPLGNMDRCFIDPVTSSKFRWVKNLCNGCGSCVSACPHGAITIERACAVVKLPDYPCSAACPAGVDIARYIRFIASGKLDEAVSVIREKMPFPAVCAYVCLSPCENACQRGWLDNPILIRELKRAAIENERGGWKHSLVKPSPTGHRAAIIGSGPAGLTAAYFLARKGHDVTVFDAMSEPGGKMMNSIRDWHLPKDVLLKEIRDIEQAGVAIQVNHKVESIEGLFDLDFESVLSAAGLHRDPKIPPVSVESSFTGEEFLALDELSPKIKPANRVVILGGGRIAFGCALKARQIGVAEIHMVAIEYRPEGDADILESEQAVNTGLVVHSWRMFPRVVRRHDRIVGVECYKMRAFGFDEKGQFRMDEVHGSGEFIAAEVVIDTMVNGCHNPGIYRRPGFFAAGDAVSELRSVIEAIAAGRWAASAMDNYLGGDGNIEEALTAQEISFSPIDKPSTALRPEIPVNLLPGGYAQVELALSPDVAITEAGRCLSCDIGYPMHRFNIDIDRCNFCGRCIDSCCRGALRLTPT